MIKTCLWNGLSKEPLVENLLVTENSWERMKGLLATESLASQSALLISPCNSVHMFFMKYSIDVVYLDKYHKIKKIISDLKPWKMSFCLGSQCVIELPSGQADQLNLKIGQELKW